MAAWLPKGSGMNMPLPIISHRPVRAASPGPRGRTPAGFTLVEMLVVIAIIGILASLITAAAWRAVITAKNAAIVVELSQLDAACKAYKEKFGEYPPDFAGVNSGVAPYGDTRTVGSFTRDAVLRHFTKAFPRYVPGVSTNGALAGWPGLRADVLGNWPTDPWYNASLPQYRGWGLDIFKIAPPARRLSPAGALTFFLGGMPDWRIRANGTPILPGQADFDPAVPVRGFLGFSANPLNPFDNSASRIRPFYDFDLASVGCPVNSDGSITLGITYWPKVLAVSDKANARPIVYFRAENGQYTVDGSVVTSVTYATNALTIKNQSAGAWGYQALWPAIDTRLCGGMNAAIQNMPNSFTWVNPNSFQIFCSGLDRKYARLWDDQVAPAPVGPGPHCCLAFPSGENYWVDPSNGGSTFDDITNFSGGTLESAIPN
jgi:prepilin-type N-terminal cleavage/methylation domain-containing protein